VGVGSKVLLMSLEELSDETDIASEYCEDWVFLSRTSIPKRAPPKAETVDPLFPEKIRIRRDITSTRLIVATAKGFSATAVAFLPLRFCCGERLAENIVDLLHSLYASFCCLRFSARLRREQGVILVMPEEQKGRVQLFLANSLGYFLADVVLVLVELRRGRRPYQWQGRLAHHVVQTVANAHTFFGSEAHTTAGCTYTPLAYLAEISNTWLRTSNILKHLGFHSLWMSSMRMLLASFFIFRVVNFSFCTLIVVRNHRNLHPLAVRMSYFFIPAAFALNAEWFRRMVLIYVRARRSPST